MHFLKLPRLNANEDSAVVYWDVADGAAVRKNQVIATLESSKASVELEAEADGFLHELTPHGEQAAVGAVIGAIVPDAAMPREDVLRALTPPPEAGGGASGSRRWTKKAEILARAAGVAIEAVPALGEIVGEADVRAYLGARHDHPRSLPEGYYFDAPPAPRRPPDRDTGQDTGRTTDRAVGRARRILLLGDGIGAAHVLDVMLRLPGLFPCGILDDDEAKIGRSLKGVPVLGPLDEARRLWDAGRYDGAVCLLQNRLDLRRRVFEELRDYGVPFVNIIDPSVVVHSGVRLGQGNIIQPFCRIGTESVVGDNNVLSAYVNIDHHSRLGSHCTFGPSVYTSGEVFIGDSVTFGTGISIEPKIRIGNQAVIGSGAVIVSDIPDNALVRTRINYKIIEGDT